MIQMIMLDSDVHTEYVVNLVKCYIQNNFSSIVIEGVKTNFFFDYILRIQKEFKRKKKTCFLSRYVSFLHIQTHTKWSAF